MLAFEIVPISIAQVEIFGRFEDINNGTRRIDRRKTLKRFNELLHFLDTLVK